MKRFGVLLCMAALTACTPVAKPDPIPVPIPVPHVYALTPENCPTVRVTQDNGEYSGAWGGVDGLRVPENGFSIFALLTQLECRVNGVFVPFKETP